MQSNPVFQVFGISRIIRAITALNYIDEKSVFSFDELFRTFVFAIHISKSIALSDVNQYNREGKQISVSRFPAGCKDAFQTILLFQAQAKPKMPE